MSYAPNIYINAASLNKKRSEIESQLDYQLNSLCSATRYDEFVKDMEIMIGLMNDPKNTLVIFDTFSFYIVSHLELSTPNKEFRESLDHFDIDYRHLL